MATFLHVAAGNGTCREHDDKKSVLGIVFGDPRLSLPLAGLGIVSVASGAAAFFAFA